MPGWDMCKTMCLAAGTDLEQVIAAADYAMLEVGLPVASEGPAVRADALG